MKFLRNITAYLMRRYTKVQLLAIAALIIFAFFVSESNIFARLGYDSQIRDLNSQIKHYREKSVKDTERLKQLNSNKEDIEKFARENYLMKYPDEDIYIVE